MLLIRIALFFINKTLIMFSLCLFVFLNLIPEIRGDIRTTTAEMLCLESEERVDDGVIGSTTTTTASTTNNNNNNDRNNSRICGDNNTAELASN